MKKVFLFIALMTFLMPLQVMLSQALSNYISAVKGDTLVIKDYYDMFAQPNSLYWAMFLDTVNVPEGRVYMLKTNGYYPLLKIPTTKRNTVIVGEDNRILVNNIDAYSVPPIIIGYSGEGGTGAAIIIAAHNLTIKNCNINLYTPVMTGFIFSSSINDNIKITADNCLFEFTHDVFVSIGNMNCNVVLRNCYFVNMSGSSSGNRGGVFDCSTDMDTLLVENCTYIMAQGNMYDFRYDLNNNQIKRIIINHNTFINCAGSVFMNPGYQNNISLTNNIFVNCNVQGYSGDINIHKGEVDLGGLAMGFVNVYPNSASTADEPHFYVDRNLIYWDTTFNDYISTLNAKEVGGVSNWINQMVTMNPRSQSMFDDNAKYPYFTEGTWIENELPHFTDSQNLFTTQLANLKAFALEAVATDPTTKVLSSWRLINTGSSMLDYSDWPIPVNLSYSDNDLLHAGMGGFPIGDLNWFPDKKAKWVAQRTAEYDTINNVLISGKLITSVHISVILPAEFRLQQNYPNPFNPNTTINFSIPKAGYVTLKVYNVLGQEVANLLDGFRNPQTYNIKFDGTGLASGIYLYRLYEGNNYITKKMILLK